MSAPDRIDAAWLAAHPLPTVGGDKEARGRVVIVGGSASVPGAPMLTADAALRVGAGKVQLGVVAATAIAIGLHLPEVAAIGLQAEEGEIIDIAPITRQLAACDALVLGPGMAAADGTAALVAAALEALADDAGLLLDAAALTSCAHLIAPLHARATPAVMTPHHGELATLTDTDKDAIDADPLTHAQRAADRFGTVVALKDQHTIIAAPGAAPLAFVSPARGLGTAGSGDVLAGVIGGLLARGAAPRVAAAWGVWLHGEAGRAAAQAIGPIGFRASELGRLLPRVLASA